MISIQRSMRRVVPSRGAARRHVALALVVTLLLAACEKEAPPVKETVRPVRAMQVADATAFQGRKFPGRARAAQEVELSFRVAGPLVALPVKVGDVVDRGQTVAQIDQRDFNVALRNAEAQLQQARATAKKTAADVKRLDGVRAKNPGFVAEVDYDAAVSARDSAAANVLALKTSVEAAKDRLDYTTLTSPFKGVVVETYVENFEDVREKQPIVRIVDDSRIEFVVNIPENLISLSPQVEDITVEFDALPDLKVSAVIKEIGTEASLTTRTYPVTLLMEQPEGQRILPGMAGNASGKPRQGAGQDSVEVPASAVFSDTDGDKSFVWIIDEQAKTVSRREVRTSGLSERGVQVTSGLKAGEWIATAGVNYLRDGQQVRLLEQKAK